MAVDLVVPSVGESITEVQVGQWLKKQGEFAERDEAVVEIESEKATVEVVAPVSGIVVAVEKATGDIANVGDLLGRMEEAAAPDEPKPDTKDEPKSESPATVALPAARDEARVMPAAQRALAEKGLEPAEVEATGPGGRLLKEDVLRHEAPAAATAPTPDTAGTRVEEVVPMSPMRQTIAAHLVHAQHTGALLTTFNEVDMSGVMAFRKEFKDAFLEKHDVKLGFMSFFLKATVDALGLVPEINAEIREKNIVYRNYCDIGVAIGGAKGLVVPVIRNAEALSFAEIEKAIADFAERAQRNRISMEELKDGTFTISNGGVYGSLLSTPIINPPQSGILGMHAIQDRPVAVDGQVVIRPMMYVALTYDHRIVDGKGAVTFLKRIKECVENPARMLLEV